MLRYFSGGFATLFQGSATVESDFSIIKYEKNRYRSNLAHMSAEGTLHAKQHKEFRTFCARKVRHIRFLMTKDLRLAMGCHETSKLKPAL